MLKHRIEVRYRSMRNLPAGVTPIMFRFSIQCLEEELEERQQKLDV